MSKETPKRPWLYDECGIKPATKKLVRSLKIGSIIKAFFKDSDPVEYLVVSVPKDGDPWCIKVINMLNIGRASEDAIHSLNTDKFIVTRLVAAVS